ncbi:MAG: hypothetical protein C1943_13630 [Halochromatium sp.]|nr:hypothetical protein [Halochromatium sp.]
MKICLATYHLIDLNPSGLGTATTAQAQTLAREDYNVTILFLDPQINSHKSWQKQVANYARKGITLVSLPAIRTRLQYSISSKLIRYSYAAYQWLNKQEFDIIFFHDWQGGGYFSAAAKRQGLAFRETRIVTTMHCPTVHWLEGNERFPCTTDDVLANFMEKQCAADSDLVVTPTRFMMEKLESLGWQLGTSRKIVPNAFTDELTNFSNRYKIIQSHEVQKIDHLVFFGRIEPLKGIFLFIGALDQVALHINQGLLRNIKVTFLGRPNLRGPDASEADLIIREHARKNRWPFSIRFLPDMCHSDAIEWLLNAKGRLVVIPSLTDNGPYAVRENLQLGIPFVATNLAGTAEFLTEADRARMLCDMTEVDLARLLIDALRFGVRPAKPIVTIKEVNAVWPKVAQELAQTQVCTQTDTLSHSNNSWTTIEETVQLISVCIPHHNRPAYLLHAIDSVFRQDYPNIELVLVDDGSDTLESKKILTQLEDQIEQGCLSRDGRRLPCRLIRQVNRYVGAARNAGVRLASGDWVAFLDDDDVAMPNWLSTMQQVASHTNADIVTCMVSAFHGEGYPSDSTPEAYQWLALGNAPELGFFANVYGAYCALYRRSVFNCLGGFIETNKVTFEDYALLSKAALEDYQIEYIAQPLIFYRLHHQNHIMGTTSFYRNRQLGLVPYLDVLPKKLHPTAMMMFGMWWSQRNRKSSD